MQKPPKSPQKYVLSPRLTDWGLAFTVTVAGATGLLGLVSGHTEQWAIFALHGIAGFWLLLLLWDKMRRVWPRLVQWRRWDRRTILGPLALIFALSVVGSGIWWIAGGELYFMGFNLLNWHILLGFVLVATVTAHMFARAKRLRTRDIARRRYALALGTFFTGGLALWPLQELTDQTLHLPGTSERFTGSRESNSYQGNIFPTSSWVADQPHPIDLQSWQLSLGGAVHKPRAFSYAELSSRDDVLKATLDCTGGFYSTQRWHGMRIDHLLDQVEPHADARFVSFVSVTSYRWSLPLEEARKALLATSIDGDPLSYEHGFPLRLVAPNRRGFEWVKWITHIEILTNPDPGQLVSIFTSSFVPS